MRQIHSDSIIIILIITSAVAAMASNGRDTLAAYRFTSGPSVAARSWRAAHAQPWPGRAQLAANVAKAESTSMNPSARRGTTFATATASKLTKPTVCIKISKNFHPKILAKSTSNSRLIPLTRSLIIIYIHETILKTSNACKEFMTAQSGYSIKLQLQFEPRACLSPPAGWC